MTSSEWKLSALKIMPSFKYILEDPEIDSIEAFWLELYFEFTKNHFELSTSVDQIKQVFEFARFCLYSKDLNIKSAVVVNFFEDLVQEKWAYDSIHLWITPEDFLELDSLFQSRLTPEEFDGLRMRFFPQ